MSKQHVTSAVACKAPGDLQQAARKTNVFLVHLNLQCEDPKLKRVGGDTHIEGGYRCNHCYGFNPATTVNSNIKPLIKSQKCTSLVPKREHIAPKRPHPPPQSKTNTIRSAELLSKLAAGGSPGCISWGCKSLGLAFPGKKNVSLLLNVNEFLLLIPSEFEYLGKVHPCTLRYTPDTATLTEQSP